MPVGAGGAIIFNDRFIHSSGPTHRTRPHIIPALLLAHQAYPPCHRGPAVHGQGLGHVNDVVLGAGQQRKGLMGQPDAHRSGIGAATARQLSANGAAVALAARRKDRLENLAKEIGDAGGASLVIECDVTNQDEAADAVERTVSELGRLDTLVNNAGAMLLGPAADAPLSEWQRMVELNILGLLYCAHAATPHLLRAATDGPRHVADMVNVSSVAGRVARSGNGVYSLTKHGVGAFSESLRQELTKRYVRVSLVEPGATATELASHNRAAVLESLKGQIGQTMAAEDIADAITYIVTRPRTVAVNEILIRPTEQER